MKTLKAREFAAIEKKTIIAAAYEANLPLMSLHSNRVMIKKGNKSKISIIPKGPLREIMKYTL